VNYRTAEPSELELKSYNYREKYAEEPETIYRETKYLSVENFRKRLKKWNTK